MKFRVGYGGPKQYRHGRRFPGGRNNNGGMSEIERLIHLIASMQILFGSRRGGWLIPVLIIGVGIGGFLLYRTSFSPESALETAHALWDSDDTKEQIKAIRKYKELLRKSDPIEPGRHWLMNDRDTLYRRIISHEFRFARNRQKAAEWIKEAWDEGFQNLRFSDEEVKSFWVSETEPLRQRNVNRNRNLNQAPNAPPSKLPGFD
ncbi:MAG: hypothetical protein AAF623_13345 [Planctomycetota bacterium]